LRRRLLLDAFGGRRRGRGAGVVAGDAQTARRQRRAEQARGGVAEEAAAVGSLHGGHVQPRTWNTSSCTAAIASSVRPGSATAKRSPVRVSRNHSASPAAPLVTSSNLKRLRRISSRATT